MVSLTETEMAVLFLHYYDELAVAEIARMARMSEPDAASFLGRALSKAKFLIRGLDERERDIVSRQIMMSGGRAATQILNRRMAAP